MLAQLAVAPDRNYPALFLSLDDALEALAAGLPTDEALQRSFEGAAEGFGAEKALLLVREGDGRLKAVASRGLSWMEVAASESGLSVPGVSSSCIREAIERGEPVLVQDPDHVVGANVSEVLRLQPCSVLCAPVSDPRTRAVRAVLYFQNDGVRNAFGEIDRAWIEVYARTLGRTLAGAR